MLYALCQDLLMANMFLCKIDRSVMMYCRDAVKGTSVRNHLLTCVGWHAQRPLTGAHKIAKDIVRFDKRYHKKMPPETQRDYRPNVLPPAGDHTTEAQEQHVQPSGAKVQSVTTIQPIPIQSLINTTNENPQKTCTLTCCDEAHNVQSAGDK